MAATPYSVVVTTLNNGDTLDRCLGSVADAAEIVVLDSGSDDATLAIARHYGARVEQRAFQGYGAQKQAAIDLASHDWVLLLDADEALSPALSVEIAELMVRGPQAAGYRLRRREQLFWRWQCRGTRLIEAVRLFDRRRCRMSAEAVHAAIRCDSPVARLNADLLHYGETDIHYKVARINAYSSGMVAERLPRNIRWLRLRMIAYPSFAFFREYVLRRQCLNGWAGFIAARSSAFYAFLKYAKLYDARQRRGSDLLDRRRQHYRSPGEDVAAEADDVELAAAGSSAAERRRDCAEADGG
ncbi:MAG: glycosyltransferase family 2 protein [Wenzhouxiangellaceae bacterium]